jgi:hypothetical protein
MATGFIRIFNLAGEASGLPDCPAKAENQGKQVAKRR